MIERLLVTGGIGVNGHDRTEEEQAIQTDNDLIIDLRATASDIGNQAVAFVASVTDTPATDSNDVADDAVSDSTVRLGSRDMSDMDEKYVEIANGVAPDVRGDMIAT